MFGYEVADAIMEYYGVNMWCSKEDIESAKTVLEEMLRLTKDKWYQRAIDECERYLREV